MNFIIIFLISLIVSYLLTPLVKKLAARVNGYDYPSDRRINKIPIPNTGGIAIFIAFMISYFFFNDHTLSSYGIMFGASFIFLLGLIDDIFEISPLIKLLGQIGAASILIYYGIQINFITNPFGGMVYLGYFSIPITILWVVGIINTVNLIDGLDGLAAGISIIATFTLFSVALQEYRLIPAILAVALAGSLIGFLKYNFYPAEIFMGDSGSMFTGYILAAISITGALKSAAAVTIVVPILALGVPIFDTIFAIVRRIYNNKPIGKADRGHIHHRLLDLGWSHKQAVIIVYGGSILLGATAMVINGLNIKNGMILFALAISVLIYVAWRLGIFSTGLSHESSVLEETN
ncbi:MAG: undecaprenyl/decaprenyl-phosphate alpha-N-acetylglucosaminyl 1-phosphate transferase [Halanaerobiales bacterium]|nr:undecaprenyl/decaprenyl-phosphate alpha-N-acetylglucosaminyl 1-phosphate transferase [Halanaerobiales bacterium]